MENEILEIMEAGMKRRLIFSDMLELQKIARAVNLATKAHYEDKITNKPESENGKSPVPHVSGSFIALQKISAGVYLKFNEELNLSLADCDRITKFIIKENDDLLASS